MEEQPERQKRLRIPSEVAYLLAILLIAVAVRMTVTAGFGVSVIVAPAYLVSEKIPALSFGMAEYLLQGILFCVFCVVVRRFRPVYLSSFLTCVVYGLVLDGLQKLVPLFDPARTQPALLPFPARVALFAGGMILTSFSIALFFKIYLYPQVYDFFVVGVVARYRLREGLFKTLFDLVFLALTLTLSFSLFGRLVGIGWGSVIMAVLNGSLIGLFSRLLDRAVLVSPLFPSFAAHFAI